MKIERKFTTEATGAYGAMAFVLTTSEIRNPDGISGSCRHFHRFPD